MLEFKVGCKELVAAIKKANVGGNNVNYCVMPNLNKKDENDNYEFFISSSAADETVNMQSMITFTAELLKAEGQPRFIAGTDFAKAVLLMAEFNKELTITYEEDVNVRIACEDAETFVPIKEEFKSLSLKQNEKMVGVIIKTELLKRAVKKGAIYTPDEDTVYAAKDSVQCKICRVDGESVLRVISSNFERGTYCDVPLEMASYVEGGEQINVVEEERFAVKASMLDLIINNLSADMTKIVCGQSVAQISCGDASYVITLVAKNYPATIEMLLLEPHESIRVTVNKKAFLTAVNLAALTSEEKMPVCLSVGDGFIEVKDMQNKSHTSVSAKIEGSLDGDIGLHQKNFKIVSNNLVLDGDGEFTFSTDGKHPIYFYDQTPRSAAFIIPISLKEANKAAEEKK